jgi:hypothetical protein
MSTPARTAEVRRKIRQLRADAKTHEECAQTYSRIVLALRGVPDRYVASPGTVRDEIDRAARLEAEMRQTAGELERQAIAYAEAYRVKV